MKAETEDIFRQRFLPLYKQLFAAAQALLNNADDAADAVQDTMVKVWNHRDELAAIESPLGFSMKLLRTTALDLLRRRNLRSANMPQTEPAATEPADPDSEEFLLRAISTLPAEQQETLRLSAFANLSADEIARATGRTPANVRQQLCRARRKIRELYQKYM